MADHLSDEEQLERLKKWWSANGTSLLLAIVVVAGGWFGWNYWQNAKQSKAEESSLVYMAMLDALGQWEQERSDDKAAQVASHAETLKKLGEDSRYGVLAALTVARLSATDGDYDEAAQELEWALSSSKDEALNGLLRLRLAKVEFARDNAEAALKQLDSPHPASYKALYETLKGDIFVSSGDNAKAQIAYQSALDSLTDQDSRAKAVLELKLNELAPASPAKNDLGKEEA